jgi:anti-sigma regulatory factor (Ser/Thr protein kinase)
MKNPRNHQTQNHCTLVAVPSSAGTARGIVTDVLTRWGLASDLIDDAVTVASELVDNAIIHGQGAHFELRIERQTSSVRLSVLDQSPKWPKVRRNPDGETGRGLILVQALSKEWGVLEVQAPRAKWVWARLGP